MTKHASYMEEKIANYFKERKELFFSGLAVVLFYILLPIFLIAVVNEFYSICLWYDLLILVVLFVSLLIIPITRNCLFTFVYEFKKTKLFEHISICRTFYGTLFAIIGLYFVLPVILFYLVSTVLCSDFLGILATCLLIRTLYRVKIISTIKTHLETSL